MDRQTYPSGNPAMTGRNMESRILKLESRGQRVDQFLAVWRKPDGDTAAVLADARFSHGDRVICIEWFGDDPIPAPKWHRNIRPDFSETEQQSVFRSIERLYESGALKPLHKNDQQYLTKFTDGELLHMALGVDL